MNLQEIRKIAKKQGIKPGKLTKLKLIRSIQNREGNFECFATALDGICDQFGCCWREDCFRMADKLTKT